MTGHFFIHWSDIEHWKSLICAGLIIFISIDTNDAHKVGTTTSKESSTPRNLRKEPLVKLLQTSREDDL